MPMGWDVRGETGLNVDRLHPQHFGFATTIRNRTLMGSSARSVQLSRKSSNKATLATEEVMGRLKKQMDELAAQIEKTGNQ
eukprot:1033485-Pyramimonas_sp.AAC.1